MDTNRMSTDVKESNLLFPAHSFVILVFREFFLLIITALIIVALNSLFLASCIIHVAYMCRQQLMDSKGRGLAKERSAATRS